MFSLDFEVPARCVLAFFGGCTFVISSIQRVPFGIRAVFVFGFMLRVGSGELLTQILTSRETLSSLLQVMKSGRTPETFVSRALGEPDPKRNLHVSNQLLSN